MTADASNRRAPEDPDSISGDIGSLLDEIVALSRYVEAMTAGIDQAIVRELQTLDPDGGHEAVVIDDITPVYQKVRQALDGCLVQIAIAADYLREATDSAEPRIPEAL